MNTATFPTRAARILAEQITDYDRETARTYSNGSRKTLYVYHVQPDEYCDADHVVGWFDAPVLRGDWDAADVADLADIFGESLALRILGKLRELSAGNTLVKIGKGAKGTYYGRIA